jgi:DNA repair protein RecO (recombination protein O)
LRILGHMPALENCAECGTPVATSGRLAFGLIDGGVLCNRCRTGKKQIATVSAGALRTMAQLADPAAITWQRMEITPHIMGELRGILNRYLTNLLGHKPRMYEYLGVLGR